MRGSRLVGEASVRNSTVPASGALPKELQPPKQNNEASEETATPAKKGSSFGTRRFARARRQPFTKLARLAMHQLSQDRRVVRARGRSQVVDARMKCFVSQNGERKRF